MKKILTAALAAIVMATALTGCVPAENEPDSNQSSSNGNTLSDNSEVGTGIADHLEETMKAYLESVKNNPNLTFYPMQEESALGAVCGKTDDGYLYLIVHENGEKIADVMTGEIESYKPEMEGADNSAINYPENGAGELAKKAIETDAWTYLEAASDQETVSIVFSEDFKLDLCEEYFFAAETMSGQLSRVVVIKPKSGNME